MNSQNNYVHIDFWYGSCEKPFIIEQKNKCNKDIINIYKCCGKSILMKAYCCDECHIIIMHLMRMKYLFITAIKLIHLLENDF